MKVIDFFKYAVIFAAFFVVLFVAGCGDNNNPDGDNPENNPTIPKEPPSVSGGSLTKTGGEPVTQASLDDFIDVFYSALYVRRYYSIGTRALPDEKDSITYTNKYSYTYYGNYSGKVEITLTQDYSNIWTATSQDRTNYSSGTQKYFDFSNHDSLFLGGAVGYLSTGESKEKDLYNNAIKANGTINFAGKYQGKLVLENVTFINKYKNVYYDSTYNEEYGYWSYQKRTDTLEYGITGGNFYVQNNDGQIISLRDYGYFFTDIQPYSDSTGDYPAGQITVKMPTVPSAPNGSLSERAGNNAAVNSENVSDFFRAFVTELDGPYYNSSAPRAINEGKGTKELLEHGKASGYFSGKSEAIFQENNIGTYSSGTITCKYDDYSNEGVLYFGGGYGSANFNRKEHFEECGKYTSEINGKIKFNGQFRGELDFQNFRYDYNSESGYTSSGKVTISTLDVTDRYLEFVIREFPIYDYVESKTGEIAGVYAYERFENGKDFIYALSLKSDGTGTRIDNYGPYICYSGNGWHSNRSSGYNNSFTYEFDEDSNTGVVFYHYDSTESFTFDGYDTVIFDGKPFTRK